MAAPGERAGSVYVYVVSALLFLAILVGGGFLVLYVALPETPSTAWFPAAGMSLVATPWLFWVATFLYRAVKLRNLAQQGGAGAGGRGEDRSAAPAPVAVAAVAEDPPDVDSPAGGRRVRFGAVTVMGGSSRDASASGGDGYPSTETAEGEEEEEEESEGSGHGTPTSASDEEGSSSLTSPAIELPLFAQHRTGHD